MEGKHFCVLYQVHQFLDPQLYLELRHVVYET